MRAESMTALQRLEAAVPASYIASVGLLRSLRDRLVTSVAPRMWAMGRGFLETRIVATYASVATAANAAEAAEELLTEWGVRVWMVNFELHASQPPGSSEAAEPPLPDWLPRDIGARLRILRNIVAAFNRCATPSRVPPTLTLLLKNAATPAFNQVFDDVRLPASVRLAYYSHRKILLHAWALHLAHERRLPGEVTSGASAALRADIALALGLAAAMPGADAVIEAMSSDLSDIEVLDVDAEQTAWNAYLRDAGALPNE